MFAAHVKGQSQRLTLDMLLERTGASYVVERVRNLLGRTCGVDKLAKEGTIIVIEDIDAIEPSKWAQIRDRLSA